MAVAGPNPAGASRGVSGGSGGERTREEAELLVAPLLSRANLLRMRGQWDEAVAVCTEALRRAPESATAHSLLGDIYEAQGKLDDALQWYGMAVDLAPDRPADREKLERVTRAQRAKLRAVDGEREQALASHRQRMTGRLAAAPGAAPGSSVGRAAAERTVEWFDRLFPPGRSESIARLIFAACGVLAALIVAAAAFVYATGGASRDRGGASLMAGDSPSSGLLPPLTPPRAPVVVTVAPPPTPPAARSPQVPPATSGGQAAAAVPQAPAPAADAAAAPRARVERVLAGSGVLLTALRAGARGGAPAQMEVAVAAVGGEAPAATQERVARAAAVAARTLAMADADADRIAVRVLLRLGAAAPGPAGAPPSDTPIFSGETTAQEMRAADPALCPTQTLLAHFTGTAWLPVPGAAVAGVPVPAATPGAAAPSPTPSGT